MTGAGSDVVHIGGLGDVAAEPVCEIVPVGSRPVGAVLNVDLLSGNGEGGSLLTGPRAGVQVIDWVLGGELRHRHDLDEETQLTAGALAALTAGRGARQTTLATAEEGAAPAAVRLWLALPRRARDADPAFVWHAQAPTLEGRGIRARVLAGELAGVRSPLPVHTPLTVADLTLGSGGRAVLPLEGDFEHAVLPLAGTVRVDGTAVEPGEMLYLGRGRVQVQLGGSAAARTLLLGGEPFGESVAWRRGILAGSTADLEEIERRSRLADA